MNKVIRVFCMLLIWQNIQAQNNIKTWEYWFDSDYESVVREPISPAEISTIDKKISVSGLSFGLHTLNFRFEDELNTWSPSLSRFFSYYGNSGVPVIRQVTQLQYWFDENFDQVNTVDIATTAKLNLDEQIDVSALNQGLHTLNYRFKDEAGGWSPALSRFFSYYTNSGIPVIRQVTQLQYWYDENFDQVNAVDISATAKLNLDELIDVSALKEGLHTLNYRFKDEAGGWSSALSRFFSYYTNSGIPVIRQVTQLQYWYDENFGQVNTVDISATSKLNLDELIDVSALNQGLHNLNYRFKDELNGWSPALSRFFSYYTNSGIPVIRQVTQLQYWYDENFGQVNTVDISATSKLNLDELIDVSALNQGLHTLNYRFKDEAGGWSLVLSRFFSKYDLPLESPDNQTIAYRYLIDENVNTMKTVVLDIPFQSYVLSNPIDVSDYPSGEHFLSVQFKDKLGQWSPAVSDTVVLELNPSAILSASTTKACRNEEIVFFADTVDVTGIVWNFGDGKSSVELNPVHKYDTIGKFEVSAVVGHFKSNRIKTVKLLDSITVYPIYDIKIEKTVCSNELPYSFGKQLIVEAGIFTGTFQTIHNCDSLVTLHLTINQAYDIHKDLTICETELPYEFGTQSLTKTGEYTEVFEMVTGCDSIVTLKFKVTDCSKINQTLYLNQGWNIISAQVVPANLNLKDIFQPLINSGTLKKVMDETGKSIENFGVLGGWKNNIGSLIATEGYKVNMIAPDSLSLEGTPVQLPLDINLNIGWNIISYPCAYAQDAKALVQSLIDLSQLKKVMDETGKSIENFGVLGGWKNNIGNFVPGKGYKVNVTENCILSIPVSGSKSAMIVSEVPASEHFKTVFIGNGTDHMNVNLVNLQTSGLLENDQIGVFDGKLCVGSAMIGAQQLMDGSISIAASACDQLNETVNGFTSGNPVLLQMYRGGHTYSLNSIKLDGIESFEMNASMFAQVNINEPTDIQSIGNISRFKCYPNPFTKEITIEIQNFIQGDLTVEIYNMTGQRIKSLFKGIHSSQLLLKWNGTNDAGQQVAPGVYLCKVNGQSKQVIFEGAKGEK